MTQPTRIFDQASGAEPVSGFLHKLAGARDGLVLTHGAGGNCNSPLLVALAEHFSDNGIAVLRCDLPFRQKRPHGPPSPASAVHDQEGLRRALEILRQHAPGRLFLGGSSYGGRQASLLLARGSVPDVTGLLLLSYPLHPPGKAAQLRTAHFPELRVPSLFVSGTRDPFGSPEELASALDLIPARHRLTSIEGAGHDLWPKTRRAEIPGVVYQEFANFF